MTIYTGKGDDGSTGLLFGGRVSKADFGPEAYGTVDEAVSAIGVARALASDELAAALLAVQRDLFVAGAELATAPANRAKLEPGTSLVTTEMVERVERGIDEVVDVSGLPTEFVVPGGSSLSAALDVARTVVRRAERRCVQFASAGGLDGSLVVPYLNRLADYLYVLARSVEAEWASTRPEEEG